MTTQLLPMHDIDEWARALEAEKDNVGIICTAVSMSDPRAKFQTAALAGTAYRRDGSSIVLRIDYGSDANGASRDNAALRTRLAGMGFDVAVGVNYPIHQRRRTA